MTRSISCTCSQTFPQKHCVLRHFCKSNITIPWAIGEDEDTISAQFLISNKSNKIGGQLHTKVINHCSKENETQRKEIHGQEFLSFFDESMKVYHTRIGFHEMKNEIQNYTFFTSLTLLCRPYHKLGVNTLPRAVLCFSNFAVRPSCSKLNLTKI